MIECKLPRCLNVCLTSDELDLEKPEKMWYTLELARSRLRWIRFTLSLEGQLVRGTTKERVRILV
jgi:hypothetical protein